MQKILLPLTLVVLMLVGCKPKHPDWSQHRAEDEERATVLLDQARASLEKGDYKMAEVLLDSMRRSCRLALDARQQGIPLADSIMLARLRAELMVQDSIMHAMDAEPDAEFQRQYEECCNKIKFYMRKLNHDTKR